MYTTFWQGILWTQHHTFYLQTLTSNIIFCKIYIRVPDPLSNITAKYLI